MERNDRQGESIDDTGSAHQWDFAFLKHQIAPPQFYAELTVRKYQSKQLAQEHKTGVPRNEGEITDWVFHLLYFIFAVKLLKEEKPGAEPYSET